MRPESSLKISNALLSELEDFRVVDEGTRLSAKERKPDSVDRIEPF